MKIYEPRIKTSEVERIFKKPTQKPSCNLWQTHPKITYDQRDVKLGQFPENGLEAGLKKKLRTEKLPTLTLMLARQDNLKAYFSDYATLFINKQKKEIEKILILLSLERWKFNLVLLHINHYR